MAIVAAVFASLIGAALARHNTNRVTFLLGFGEQRCFKEMFYYGSNLDLFMELVEPAGLPDLFINDPAVDGIRYVVMQEGHYTTPIEGVLGNTAESSFSSYSLPIDHPGKEGIYRVCLSPSESIFYNAQKLVDSKSEQVTMFGKVFEAHDYAKLSFEVSLTLERVYHGTFQTLQELNSAHASESKREKMAATNMILSESINKVDELVTAMSEEVTAIQDAQAHEFTSCVEYIEELHGFDDKYTFW